MAKQGHISIPIKIKNRILPTFARSPEKCSNEKNLIGNCPAPTKKLTIENKLLEKYSLENGPN